MEIRTYKVYKFNELTEEGKEKAIQNFRENNYDTMAWDSTKEDASQVGVILHGTEHGYMRGEFKTSAEDTIYRILKEHGEDCETYKTAKLYKKEIEKAKNEDDEFDIKKEFLASICEDYRIYYEREEEYMQSDEYIKDTIEANDYYFTEDGKID